MIWLGLVPGSFLVGAVGGYLGAVTLVRRLTYRTRTRRP